MILTLPLTLQTKVGRRIALLFVVSALLPVMVLAFVGYAQVRGQLVGQSRAQLDQGVRDAGMGLLARLEGADSVLLDVAGGGAPGSTTPLVGNEPGQRLVRQTFASMAVFDHGTLRMLWGRPPRVELTPAEVRRLRDGGRVLRIDSAGPQTWLVTVTADGAQLWGAVADSYLFRGIGAREGTTDARLCVRAAGTLVPLFCPNGSGTGASLTARWQLFLGYEFGAQPWLIEASQPMAAILEPVVAFRQTFLFSIAGVFGLVVLLSSVQVRRSLQPLMALGHGTRRLAQRDFSGTVSVSSGDEFEELAESFNRMAGEMDQHFRTMTAAGAIDQSALVARRSEDVAATAAGRLRDALRCEEVRVYMAGDRREDAWRLVRATHVEVHGDEGMDAPAEADLQRLRAARGRWLDDDGGFGWTGARAAGPIVLFPLVSHDELVGAVAVHTGNRMLDDHLGVARQLADQLTLGLSNARLITRLSGLSYGALAALARTIDANSKWTSGHSERVTSLSVRIAVQLGLPVSETETLYRAGLLHDIGKIGVPAYILDHPGPLSPSEMALMQKHPVLGAEILTPIAAFADAIPIVRYHHERLDGGGYPDGLSGDEIPFLARLLTVADVYDALVSDRPYRVGLLPAEAIEVMRADVGTGLDPAVVAAFLAVLEGEGDSARFVDARPGRVAVLG